MTLSPGDINANLLIMLAAMTVFHCPVDAGLRDGLYVSNGTHILLIDNRDAANQATGRPVLSPINDRRIVGLAYIRSSGLLFWSDINRWTTGGIYRAQTDSSGNLANVTRIIDSDVQEVNGLTADWVSNNIYWTDGRKRTIEVADHSGTNRRVLVYQNLIQPRGIYADPIGGWLYWNDQGTHQTERSRLDGSAREVFVNNDSTSLPNQLAVYNRALYWVDSNDKTLRSKTLDSKTFGAPISLASATRIDHVFGLAINDNTAYVTSWSSNAQLLKVDLNTKAVTVTGKGLSSRTKIFSAVFVSSNVQTDPNPGNRPCLSNPCEQLCLPTRTSAYRCSCSSYGGKTLKDGGSCQTPSNIVLFAIADNGFVGFHDPLSNNTDLYFVGRSSRPVAVAYDPINQSVFWSDVKEKNIYRSKLDGSSSSVFLGRKDGVGIVDVLFPFLVILFGGLTLAELFNFLAGKAGMAVDYVGRQLYYSNIGSVSIGTKTYSWHKVETVNIDSDDKKIKTMLSDIADKPRAIAIDVTNAKLYYTDWGSKASVVRANLDGSNPEVIKTGLYNPNGLVLSGNQLFVADSNYKTRSQDLGTPQNGSVYRMSIDGAGWTDILDGQSAIKLKTPFGLSLDGTGTMYVSDWETNGIFAVNVNKKTSTLVISASRPMGLLYTAVSIARTTRPASCSPSSCGDICLSQTPSTTKCSCGSYRGKALNSDQRTCSVPTGYMLVSDMDGVKLVSLDRNDDPSVYVTTKSRPIHSNIVALTYDATTKTIYYSDVARKKIYAHNVANDTSTEFYQINNVIDGMTIDNGTLYWTDSKYGQISNCSTDMRKHTTVLSDLDKPRAIKIYNGYIYWTEWGINHRVARMPLGGREPTEYYSTGLNWPNALFVYKNRIYVADGFLAERKLINCSLSLNDCRPVDAVTNDKVQHMYDIWIANDILYYTDWNTSSVNALSLTTGISLQPIATGLLRPSQLYFIPGSSTKGLDSTSCSSSSLNCTGPGSSCIQLLGNQQCQCSKGSVLSSSTACVMSQSLTCGMYSLGDTFQPQGRPCLSCQCLRNRFYGNPEHHFATCTTVTCPSTAGCPRATTPPGKCCPVCPDCLRVANCPSLDHPIILDLPLNGSVLYTFKPVIEDCLGESRNKDLRYDKLIFGLESKKVTMTVSAVNPKTNVRDEAVCEYNVQVKDKTKPVIECPPSYVVYTEGFASHAKVEWQSPVSYDNAGPPKVTSDYAWGSKLPVNTTTRVTYTATDSSGNSAECSFNVNVLPGANCLVPRLLNGNLICGTSQSGFSCKIVCNLGFNLVDTFGDNFTCINNKWDKPIADNFERLTCIRNTSFVVRTIGFQLGKGKRRCVKESYTEDYLRPLLISYAKREIDAKFDISHTVKATCPKQLPSSASHDVHLLISFSGEYQNIDEESSLIDALVTEKEKIETALMNGLLEVLLTDGTQVWRAELNSEVEIEESQSTECPPGTFKKPMGCVVCPGGTFQLNAACVACPKGTYNEKERQVKCTPCPQGRTTSRVGADIVDQCNVPDDPPPSDGPGIVLVVVIPILLVAFVVVVVVVVFYCMKQGGRNSRRKVRAGGSTDVTHTNQCYEDSSAFIYEDIQNASSATMGETNGNYAHLNHYETLHSRDAKETSNDVMYSKIEPAAVN